MSSILLEYTGRSFVCLCQSMSLLQFLWQTLLGDSNHYSWFMWFFPEQLLSNHSLLSISFFTTVKKNKLKRSRILCKNKNKTEDQADNQL